MRPLVLPYQLGDQFETPSKAVVAKAVNNNLKQQQPEQDVGENFLDVSRSPAGLQTKNSSKTGGSQDTYRDAAQDAALQAIVNDSEPIKDQRAGINKMQDYLNMQTQAEAGRDRTNLAPLAALADFENAKSGIRSNLASSVAPPPEVVDKMMGYQKQLQDEKNSLTKNFQEGMKNLKSGKETSSIDKLIASGLGQNGINSPDRQFGMLTRQIKSDPQLKGYVSQVNNLNGAITNTSRGEVATPTQLNELMGVVNSNLGIKGNTSAGERKDRYMKSLGLDAVTAAQWATGNPTEIPGGMKNPILRHILDLANNEVQNATRNHSARMDELTAGTDYLTGQNPQYQKDLESLRLKSGKRLQLTPETTQMLEQYAPHKGVNSGGSDARRKAIEAATNQAELDAAMKVQ